MATVQEAIRRLTIVATKQGVDEATGSLNQLAGAQQRVAVVGQQTERATLSQEKRFEALERRYVDTVRAQQEYDKVQRLVNRLSRRILPCRTAPTSRSHRRQGAGSHSKSSSQGTRSERPVFDPARVDS